MKAAVLYGKQDIRCQEREIPQIGSEEILIKVRSSGICGSDIPRVLGDNAHYYPLILGHEFSGEVVAKGKDVKSINKGDRIAGTPLLPCHTCIDCLQGNYAQCSNYSFIGSREDGSWAEYVKIPAINAVKLPESVSFIQGAFFEPFTVGLHSLFLMNFRGEKDLAVLGVGTIGLLTLQAARILGAKRIFAFDIDEERLGAAREYGADVCINTRSSNFREIIAQETEGRGFEQIIESAGVEFTEKLSLDVAANKGNVMFIGTPSRELTLTPREFEQINRKELTIRGSWMSYSAPFPGKEWELTSYYFQQGLFKVDRLIDRCVSLEEVGDVFKDIAGNRVKGKVLIQN